MTTIVYNNGVLSSDSAAVTGNSVTYIAKHQKIKMTDCKRLAYGVSGMVIDPDWVPELELQLIAFLLEQRAKPSFRTKMPLALKELIVKRDFILMTKDEVYTKYDHRGDDIYVSKLVLGEFACVGTGREYATIACLAGKTAKQAVDLAIQLDYFTYPSEVLSIKQSALKAFPKEVK